MGHTKDSAISRREFARRAAYVSAAASLTPTSLLHAETAAYPAPTPQSGNAPKLSSENQAEVDSRIQAILARYDSRLTEAQKTDIRRLATEAQPPLDRLRSFATENGDGPGLYLKPLIEREKKPVPKAAPKTVAAPKTP